MLRFMRRSMHAERANAMHSLHAELDIASGQAPRPAPAPRLRLYDTDELLELGRIVAQCFAWPVIDDPPAIHHHGARRNIERKT